MAAKRFRERGLEGIGVADVMKEAGVTVGGFYKHFGSRDELVVEALATAFKDLDVWEEHTPDMAHLLQNYLTEAHRDAPGRVQAEISEFLGHCCVKYSALHAD